MKIEIITTGDEILSGNIVDTNTAWLSDQCWRLGLEVVRHTSVPDDAESISEAVLTAASNDIVIITGGLGPTSDDITVEAFAKAFGKKMVLSQEALKQIDKMLIYYGRAPNESQTKQAYIPEGAKILENKVGTVPGIRMKIGRTECFILPGVPKEMKQIFSDFVFPYLKTKLGKAVSYDELIIRCFDMAEADINERLKTLDLSGLRLSYRVRSPEILLKLVARNSSLEDSKKLLKTALKDMKLRLSHVIYGTGDDEFPQVVAKLLLKNKMTIATAESCTGGYLANWITDFSGSSEYFERGVVTYSNQSKIDILNVKKDTLKKFGAVSAETACEMAKGILKISGADVGISITGVAGPTGGTKAKPVGTVFVGLAAGKNVYVREFHYLRDRTHFKQTVAAAALNMVRLFLQGESF